MSEQRIKERVAVTLYCALNGNIDTTTIESLTDEIVQIMRDETTEE